MVSRGMIAGAGVVCVLAGAPAAAAQDETRTYALGEALQVCARVSEPAARLSCFEELARNAAPATAASPLSPTGSQALTGASINPPADRATEEENTSRFIVMRADEFEKEKNKVNGPAERPREPYEATVLRAWRHGNGEYQIALGNGEIWKNQATDVPRPIKDGETVELQPGALGGWFMHFKTLKRPAIRVTRVE